jgi:carnosine N-methyltransferase
VTHTFAHIVREWSSEGKEERDQSFGILMKELDKRYPDKSNRKNVRIFVPGAKLARLPFMIAQVLILVESYYYS